jgi:undecaprenyl-diphosphatase
MPSFLLLEPVRSSATRVCATLRPPRRSLALVGLAGAGTTLVLTANAMTAPLAPFDRPVIDAVQEIDLPLLVPTLRLVTAATNSSYGPLLWGGLLLLLLAIRWWLPALVMLGVPCGGVLGNLIGAQLSIHTRPDAGQVQRVFGDWHAPSFPSGHVLGAVMLYGFMFYLAARVPDRRVRAGIRAVCIVVIGLVGFGRIWIGAHWPSDVAAAYALGATVLAAMIITLEQLEYSWHVLGPPEAWLLRRLRLRA